jgi:hypothetical protein
MKQKLTEQYKNRYGDVFTFSYDPEKDLVFWQGNFEYCRYSWENQLNEDGNRYCMVDPSGGPYISSGMESKFIISKLEGKYVDYMSLNKDEGGKILSVNVHLKPLKK